MVEFAVNRLSRWSATIRMGCRSSVSRYKRLRRSTSDDREGGGESRDASTWKRVLFCAPIKHISDHVIATVKGGARANYDEGSETCSQAGFPTQLVTFLDTWSSSQRFDLINLQFLLIPTRVCRLRKLNDFLT